LGGGGRRIGIQSQRSHLTEIINLKKSQFIAFPFIWQKKIIFFESRKPNFLFKIFFLSPGGSSSSTTRPLPPHLLPCVDRIWEFLNLEHSSKCGNHRFSDVWYKVINYVRTLLLIINNNNNNWWLFIKRLKICGYRIYRCVQNSSFLRTDLVIIKSLVNLIVAPCIFVESLQFINQQMHI